MKTTISNTINIAHKVSARIRHTCLVWSAATVCVLVSFPAIAVTSSPGLNDAVSIAIADSPSLAAMQARFEAMSAIPSQVGTLPDPVLSVGALNFPTDTFHVGQEAMTQVQTGISQRLPCTNGLSIRIFPTTLDRLNDCD